MEHQELAQFVASRRKALKLTQPELAKKTGVGLRFLRELEAGKPTLRMDKVNEVLFFFGHQLVPGPLPASEPAPTQDAPR
ncbi:MAG: helix-turn-helix transcriptional regulator [Flavobacteriales bacterium]|nr:helix-turn-helix transcriptional regulator [Flavobacteriales bacterium]